MKRRLYYIEASLLISHYFAVKRAMYFYDTAAKRKFDLRLVHFDVREYSSWQRRPPTKVSQLLFCMDALYKTPSNRLSHFFANAVFPSIGNFLASTCNWRRICQTRTF